MLRLTIDKQLVDESRQAAAEIATEVSRSTSRRTTVSIERAILRLMGLDGVDADGVPWPNRVAEGLGPERLPDGVCFWLGAGLARTDGNLDAAIELLLNREFRWPDPGWRQQVDRVARRGLERISRIRRQRTEWMQRFPPASPPWFYCIVATGNIYEDVVQASAAARQGAQVIAVIRSTAQSLLDYVPFGPTTEGFAGTFATQENFRIMRMALDEVSEELGRYVFLCNYCSGLCMPEIAAIGALERLDMMLNDAMYGILFRDINMLRTLTDQGFSRQINGCAGIIINTGEDNYLKTDDGLSAAHTVLASQFINEQLAVQAGVPLGQIGLGHAFEMDPELENGFVFELAQALLSRQIFPEAPLKYMPPTRHKSGNIFKGYLQDGLFNLVSLLSGQQIQLLGMLSEAIQTPGIHDRFLALDGARYLKNNLKDLAAELEVRPGGLLDQRASQVLRESHELLQRIAGTSLLEAIHQGTFGDIARAPHQGRGLEGVYERSENYYNPFADGMRKLSLSHSAHRETPRS